LNLIEVSATYGLEAFQKRLHHVHLADFCGSTRTSLRSPFGFWASSLQPRPSPLRETESEQTTIRAFKGRGFLV
jgi:hypothetical protein